VSGKEDIGQLFLTLLLDEVGSQLQQLAQTPEQIFNKFGTGGALLNAFYSCDLS
jgi:hypothetical protein